MSDGWRHWVVGLFLGYAALIVGLSLFKSAEWFLPTLHAFERWMGGDKWMHFKLSFILAILACFASERVLDCASLRRIIAVVALLVSALFIDEALQYEVATRRFEWLDLASGLTGLAAGLLGYFVIGFVMNAIRMKRLS